MSARIPYNELGHKRCRACAEYKPLAMFGKDKRNWDSLMHTCKECVQSLTAANKDRKREYDRQRSLSNPERNRGRVKRWQEQNRGRHLKYLREHYRAHRDRRLAQTRAYRHQNLEKRRAWYHAREARKRGNGGYFTAAEWAALKAQYNHTCLCCGRREPDIKLTADHVIPLAQGGSSDIRNIQPLCLSCNSSKAARHATDYRRSEQWIGLIIPA